MRMANFRTLTQWLVPAWLNAGDGAAIQLAFMALVDAGIERLRQGLLARFPHSAGESAMRLVQQDRAIVRGRVETLAHYAERAARWRWPRGHRVRGGAPAVLEQLGEYFGTAETQSVDYGGNLCTRSAAGDFTFQHGTSWPWDTRPASDWARFWLVADLSDRVQAWAGFWNGTLAEAGTVIGLTNFAPEDTAAVRQLFTADRPWHPAGTQPQWLLVKLDPAAYDALTLINTDPAGQWATWGRLDGTTYVRARPTSFRYIALAQARNTFAGSPTVFPSTVTLPDDSTESGDTTSFPATTTLPDGTAYAGSPTSFPTPVQLPDDGSLPW